MILIYCELIALAVAVILLIVAVISLRKVNHYQGESINALLRCVDANTESITLLNQRTVQHHWRA